MTGEPDYTAMSGADFQRAVGVDPQAWAVAFRQREAQGLDAEMLERWFADAIDAGRKDGQRLARIGEGE